MTAITDPQDGVHMRLQPPIAAGRRSLYGCLMLGVRRRDPSRTVCVKISYNPLSAHNVCIGRGMLRFQLHPIGAAGVKGSFCRVDGDVNTLRFETAAFPDRFQESIF